MLFEHDVGASHILRRVSWLAPFRLCSTCFDVSTFQNFGRSGPRIVLSSCFHRIQTILTHMPIDASSMLASASAGVLARFPCHPLDTCKARLQVQGVHIEDRPYRNLPDVLKRTIRSEGFGGLYRGFGVTAIGSAPAMCLYLTSYEVFKDFFASLSFFQNMTGLAYFSSGIAAESVSCVLWVPIDVVKERLQVQSSCNDVKGGGYEKNYRGNIHALRSIMKYEGLRGIYKGYFATILSFGPFSGFMFLFYEKLKILSQETLSLKKNDTLPFGIHLINSVVAGCAAAFVTNPLDMVKLRLQVQRGVSSSSSSSSNLPWGRPYKSMLDGLKQIISQEGPRALFKGATARMAFNGPMTSISLALFETLRVWWSDNINRVLMRRDVIE